MLNQTLYKSGVRDEAILTPGPGPFPSRHAQFNLRLLEKVSVRGTHSERSLRDCRAYFRYIAPLIRRPGTRSEDPDLKFTLMYGSWFGEPRRKLFLVLRKENLYKRRAALAARPALRRVDSLH